MKILLLGKTGQIGFEITKNMPPNWKLISLGRSELDLVDTNKIRKLIREISPNIIINAAAYTKVDEAELSHEIPMKVNAEAVQVITQEANRVKAALIHYSTDYVFDGTKNKPYLETDFPNPINVYGYSKLQGEKFITHIGESYIILRTSWVYSASRENFLTKIKEALEQNNVIQVVADQVGCPTWSRDIANVTIKLITLSEGSTYDYFNIKKGIYHFCSKGSTSRFSWAQEIRKLDKSKTNNMTKKIFPIQTVSTHHNAARPKNSVLSCELFEKTFMIKIPYWKNSLKIMMRAEK